MTEEDLRRIEARSQADYIPELIAEVRILRALVDQQRRDYERLKEHAATMTNERNQWRAEAEKPAGSGAIPLNWSETA